MGRKLESFVSFSFLFWLRGYLSLYLSNLLKLFANYEILPVGSYDITPADTVAVIKKNTSRGDLKVTFRTTTLEPTKQYVLPLHIKSTSHYEVSDQHSYLFFGINKQ